MSEEFRRRSRNALLVKDDIGRAKPSVYDLPAEDFAYGFADPPDAEGAREIMHSWAKHVPRSRPGPEPQDFRKLNKLAAQQGVVSAIGVKEFRRCNDVKLTPSASMSALPKIIPSDVIPSFAYGSKSRPSTPIAALVGGRYAAEWEQLLHLQYEQLADKRDVPNGKCIVKLTKAARRQMNHAHSERMLKEADLPPPELFKLSKFKKVPPRLNLPPLQRAASLPTLSS